MEPKLTKDEKKAIRQEEWREKLDKEKKDKFWKAVALWSLGGILLVLTLWALIAFSTTKTTPTDTIKLPAITKNDYQSQPLGAKATLTEYADFQCPACKAYYPVVKQLQTDFGSKLNVVYRFFPLKTIHHNSMTSARAAYAAGLQNKFWEMHDKLFETQDAWAGLPDPEATFIGYAKDLKLDSVQFKKDYESSAAQNVVDASYEGAAAIGLNSTPTFFLNGKLIDNPQGYDPFKKLINDTLSAK